MKFKLVALLTAMVFALAPMLSVAEKPHPDQDPDNVTVDSCMCGDWTYNVEDSLWTGSCNIDWQASDGSWDAYGASVDFEARWFPTEETEVNTSSTSEVMDDDYACAPASIDGDTDAGQICSAIGVVVIVPLYQDTGGGSQDFDATVKGFDVSPSGHVSWDYAKDVGGCTGAPGAGAPLREILLYPLLQG
jgi:hypothetical protein